MTSGLPELKYNVRKMKLNLKKSDTSIIISNFPTVNGAASL